MNPSDNPTFGGMITTQEVCDLAKEYGIDPRAIFDIGACDGRDALVYAENFPDARIIAVEALLENVIRYLIPLRYRIYPYNIAIGAISGKANFYVKEINGISSLHNRGDSFAGECREMDVRTLDDFCHAISYFPDILKIDCEGATWDILKGSAFSLHYCQMLFLETEDTEFFVGQRLDNEVSNLLSRDFTMIRREISAPIDTSRGNTGRQFESLWLRNSLARR